MEDYYELNNYNMGLKKFQNKLTPKMDFHHYIQIFPNHYYSEKFSNLSDDERQSNQKNYKAIKEVFGINGQNNQNENIQIENFENNLNIKEQNNSLEENIINNSLKENENSNSNSNAYEFNSGRWQPEEHQKFIEGILKYGNEWKKVQNVIKTRSSTQARSHAQKFFLRLKRDLHSNDLSNQEILFDYILNSCYDSRKHLILSNEEKEKLMTVIRSNLKAEEIANKTEKDLLTDNNKNNFISGKNFSEFDDLIDEEDNLGYNKQMENEVLGFEKKMSYDYEEKKRKNTFCSRKRKSSSDMSFNDNFNKIFSITKDINHKRSIDISKNNHIIINNLQSKNDIKNDIKNNNNNKHNKKFNINNNNYIFNKNININNNYIKNNNRNNHETVNNITVNNVIIHNNIFQIYNCINEPSNINNNKFNNKNLYLNNNKINNYQKAISRTVIFNPDIKTSNKAKNNDIQNNSNEKEININNNIQDNLSSSNKNETQENLNKMNENEQNNPFNLDFKDFISFDTNNNSTKLNIFSEPHNNEMTEGIKTLSDKTKKLFKND